MNRDNEYIPLLSWPSFSEKKICRYQHGNGAREKSHFYRFRMLYLLTHSKHTLLPMQLHIKGLCPNSYLVSNIQYDMVNSSHHLGWCFWMRLTSEWANRVGLVLLIGRLKSTGRGASQIKGELLADYLPTRASEALLCPLPRSPYFGFKITSIHNPTNRFLTKRCASLYVHLSVLDMVLMFVSLHNSHAGTSSSLYQKENFWERIRALERHHDGWYMCSHQRLTRE